METALLDGNLSRLHDSLSEELNRNVLPLLVSNVPGVILIVQTVCRKPVICGSLIK